MKILEYDKITSSMKAALYLRLSDDDKEIGESKSITYQRKILTEYCEKNNIAIYKDYVDDGYSGKNLLRPSFKKMMEDAKKNVSIL